MVPWAVAVAPFAFPLVQMFVVECNFIKRNPTLIIQHKLCDFYFAVGKHSGIFKGREYFTCKTKHGIFVHPSRIRFTPLKRK